MNYSKESISTASKVDDDDYIIQYGNLWMYTFPIVCGLKFLMNRHNSAIIPDVQPCSVIVDPLRSSLTHEHSLPSKVTRCS